MISVRSEHVLPHDFPLFAPQVEKSLGQLPCLDYMEEEDQAKDNMEEMFKLLQNDDVDGFISLLSNNTTIDINEEEIEVEEDGYYYFIFDYCCSISHIDFCCLYGSLKCFKYLLLNKCEITQKTP